MILALYLLTMCYADQVDNHNMRLVNSVFGNASLDEIMVIVAIIIGTLVLIMILLLSVIIILCVKSKRSVYSTGSGAMSIQYSAPVDWGKRPLQQPMSAYSTSYRSKTSSSLYPCSSRTDTTTKWLLNSTSPDERLLTRQWAQVDEVIDARKTPKVARRSNVSGLVDMEAPVRREMRPPPPLSPIGQLSRQYHSYHSLFDITDKSLVV